MAAAVLLLLCWLVRISHTHSYFYPDCETMNCNRILQMSRNLDTVQRSLNSVKNLGENVCSIMDEAIDGINFDDLRIRLHLVADAADDFKPENGKRWGNIKSYSNTSNIEESIKKHRKAASEIEKRVNDISKHLENSLEQRFSELVTEVRRSKEKSEKVQRDLAQLRNRMNRLKGANFSPIIVEQKKKADELRTDAVNRSEYETETSKLFTTEFENINSQSNVLLNRLGHSTFAPEISGLLPVDYYYTILNRLKTRETKFNATLETVNNQRDILLNKIGELNKQMAENDRLIDQLKKQVSDDTRT